MREDRDPEVRDDWYDRRGQKRFNLCRCEGLKAVGSIMCRNCWREEHLRAKVARLSHVEYFPKGGRYGILGVSGYSGTERLGTTLSVLDGANNWREIHYVHASPAFLEEKFYELRAWVDDENEMDALVEVA